MYVLALSDYKQPAAAAGYKPAPQLGRQIEVYPLFRTYKLVVSNIVCTFANVNKCSLSRTFSRHSKMKASYLSPIWLNEKVPNIYILWLQQYLIKLRLTCSI